MTDKPTVFIGIPAFNEEKNIVNLLTQISQQSVRSGSLRRVIVVSDGSTDKTADLVVSFMDSRTEFEVVLIDEKERRGKAFRENRIIDETDADILVLVDADVSMGDKFFIEKLIKPISEGSADFTSAALREMPPRGFFEKVLEVSMQLKNVLFGVFKDGNNVFNCHGPARAFGRKAYELLNFPENDGEDMYSYLACNKAGMRFCFVEDVSIGYRLPSNLEDHLKQSTRFLRSERTYKHLFGSELWKDEICIPTSVYLVAAIKSLPIVLKNFVYVLVYVLVFLYTKVRVSFGEGSKETWEVSSSKSL